MSIMFIVSIFISPVLAFKIKLCRKGKTKIAGLFRTVKMCQSICCTVLKSFMSLLVITVE